jgi:hypothetical protein
MHQLLQVNQKTGETTIAAEAFVVEGPLFGKDVHRDMFIVAETYRDACFVLCERLKAMSQVRKTDTRVWMYMHTPAVILSALSIEVYFKCLIAIETGKAAWGHDLEKLFGKLDPAIQERLHREFEASTLRNPSWRLKKAMGIAAPSDLKSLLRKGKLAFEKVRYPYDYSPEELAFELGRLQIPTRNIILDRKPEWTCIMSSTPVVPANTRAWLEKRPANYYIPALAEATTSPPPPQQPTQEDESTEPREPPSNTV